MCLCNQLTAAEADAEMENLDSQLKESWNGYFLVPAEKDKAPKSTYFAVKIHLNEIVN